MKTPPTEKEKRIEEIKKILKQAIPEYNKSKNLEKVESREFKRFKEEELGEKKSLYEKLCKFSEFLNIQPDKDMAKKMQKAIDFAHLKIKIGLCFHYYHTFSGVVFCEDLIAQQIYQYQAFFYPLPLQEEFRNIQGFEDQHVNVHRF